jgi:hypothetical protein
MLNRIRPITGHAFELGDVAVRPQHRPREQMLIKKEPAPVLVILRRNIKFKHAFKAVAGLALVTCTMQRVARDSIGDRNDGRIAGAMCDAREPKRNLRQLIQQALCRHQIAGIESFGEPIVDGRQQLARLLGTVLLMLQPCKACGCSQLP